MTGPARVVLHLNDAGLRNLSRAPYLALHARIAALITARGGVVETRLAPPAMRLFEPLDFTDQLEPEALHVIENGTVRQPNVLNTSLSYLNGFFQLDAQGIHAFSSTAQRIYDPASVDPVAAASLSEDLIARHVTPRASRYAQMASYTPLPRDAIAVFLQGNIPERQGTAYCDEATMLRAVVAHAGGRPVVVKSHPRANNLPTTELVFDLLSQGHNIIPTEANVHDVLSQCVVAVSFNSAVTLEGYLHATPAILFGRSDLHHIAQTVRAPDGFETALRSALMSKQDYARYLYWFLWQQSLPLSAPDCDDQILTRFAKAGFDGARLGLKAAPRGPLCANPTLSALLRERSGLESVRIVTTEAASPEKASHIARMSGEKLRVQQVFGPGRAQIITAMQRELDLMAARLGNGNHQINRCLMAWPEDGIAVLSLAPGQRLSDKIASVAGLRQRALFAHAGRWLAAYTAPRRRHTTFGPRHWVQKLAQRDLTHIGDVNDLALLDTVLERLRLQVPAIKGTPVVQAATHGDFVSGNLFHQSGVMTAVNIRSETWLAIAKEAARFLVDQQARDATRTGPRHYGITAENWDAFLSSGVVAEEEYTTTLPFFVGEQLWLQLAEPGAKGEVAANLRAAARAYIDAAL